MPKYVLRNITTSDVMIGDLRYKIPAGKSRDLYGKGARLTAKSIEASRKSGSIAKRLGKSLVEVTDVVIQPTPPRMEVNKTGTITFPQKTKSFITIEVGDIAEEDLKTISGGEEDAYMKELELDELLASEPGSTPITSMKDDEKG